MNHKAPTLGRRWVLTRTHSAGLWRVFAILAIGLLGALSSTPAWALPVPTAPGAVLNPPAPAPAAPAPAPAPAASNSTTSNPGPCGTGKKDDDPGNGAGDSADGVAAAGIGQSAIDGVCLVMTRLDIGVAPQLTTDENSNWFKAEYNMFRTMSLWIVVPLLLMATLHTVFKGQLHQLLKIWLVYLPVAIIGGVVAVGIVQLLLNITDDFSQTFANSMDANAMRFFTGVTDGFGVNGFKAGIDLFVMIVAGLLLLFACIGVYIVLVLREASIYIAAAFLPLMLAFFVWPATAQFFKKLVEFLLAMIFSKLIMIAGIALAVAAMSAASPLTPTNATLTANGGNVGNAAAATPTGTQIQTGGGGDAGQPWFTWLGQTMTVIIMFAIVALAPNMTVKLLANVGLPNMGQHVADHNSRPDVWGKVAFVDRNWTSLTSINRGYRARKAIPRAQEAANNTTEQWRAIEMQGIATRSWTELDPATGRVVLRRNAHISAEDCADANIGDPTARAEIMALSRSNNPNDVSEAHARLEFGPNFVRPETINGERVLVGKRNADGTRKAILVEKTVDGRGRVLNYSDPKNVRTTVEMMADRGYTDIQVMRPYDAVMHTGQDGAAEFSAYGGIQEGNARLIQKELDKLNASRTVNGHRLNAHINTDSTTQPRDLMQNSANPRFGYAYEDV